MFYDPLDNVVSLQTNAYNEGFREGEHIGKKEAFLQGFKTGQKIAFNVANEMGQYHGACEMYSKQNSDSISNEKILKLATQICELIGKFDVTDCHNENFVGSLKLIRDKYNKFCSLTGTRNYFVQTATATAASKLSF